MYIKPHKKSVGKLSSWKSSKQTNEPAVGDGQVVKISSFPPKRAFGSATDPNERPWKAGIAFAIAYRFQWQVPQ